MNRTLGFGIVMVLLGGGASSVAHAQMPDTRSISLVFHSVPADPKSSVSVIVTLTMSPVQTNGSTVGWGIDTADFFMPSENGGWKAWHTGPLDVLDSPDGLWWVTHVDPYASTEAEFTLLPELTGLGEPENAGDGDLVFFIDSTISTIISNPEATFGLQTAYAQYQFTHPGDQVEGDDEPVEIDRPRDPELH